MYQNEIRDSLREQNYGAMNKTLIVEMSNMWKALPESEKEKYKKLAD